jgi:hypothetical protein
MLAPFRHRSFRFQWPADLAASWAFEMETLILGWYVLAETGSVIWLTAFGALQFIGTLVSPMLGVAGDRLGPRRVLLAMRGCYAVLAATLAVLALAGLLNVGVVFAAALLQGLVRPSDMGMRNALIGATMPGTLLMGALAVERTSADAARVVGALSGVALAVWLGMGFAYLGVTLLYAMGLLLLLGVAETRPRGAARGIAAAFTELGAGVAHVRARPALLAALCLAFLVNALAYPFSGGLLPHVARNVYGMDQTGLGTLVAAFATGALLGSLLISARATALPAGRSILLSALAWLLLLLVFAQATQAWAGMVLLFLAGAVQSFCMIPMTVLLLSVAEEGFRSRVMGLRMLAVYGMPVGLLSAGPLIAAFGFAAAATIFFVLALALLGLLALRWWRHLWPGDAPANRRGG